MAQRELTIRRVGSAHQNEWAIGALAAWPSGPTRLELRTDELHVWRARLDLEPGRLQQLDQLLSADEQKKAARFYFEADRHHYTAARGLLRTLLARYLCCEPKQIRFSYNAFGKPELSADVCLPAPAIQFNIAHSHGLALLAFNRGRHVGVDLELVRPDIASDDIAERFFAPAEVRELRSLPEEVRPRAFFNCWTRKEAFIKARGSGLSLGLSQFAVSMAPGKSAALLSAENDPGATSRWSLCDLTIGENYAAALAVEGHGWDLKCWSCPEETGAAP